MSQKSLRRFVHPTAEPLPVICRPKTTTTPVPKRGVGRPRKFQVCVDSEPTDPPVTRSPTGCVSSTESIIPPDPVAPPICPVVPHAGPSTSTGKAPGNKTIRSRYSSAQKKKVAQYARFHGGRAASRHYKIHHKNVQRWLKSELDVIKTRCRAKRCNKKGQGRKLSYPPEIDLKLLQWVLEQREEKQMPVSSHAIKLKALSLIKAVLPNFKASDGWVKGFMRRHNLVLRAKTSIAQQLPKDLESKISEFRRQVNHVRQSGNFPYELIGNMDETPVYMDMVPSKTVDVKGKKTVKIRTTKSEKCRVTAVLSCTAAGNMLPPMIIFKGTTHKSVAGVKGSNDTLVKYQKKAWMDEKLMLTWISEIWVKLTKKKPSLLFLDTFSAHLTDQVKTAFKQSNTTVIVIPGGCTSILQPLDVSINKPIKGHLRNSWVEYMLEHSCDELVKRPSKQLIVDWIEEANTILNSNLSIVKKSFLVTGISNALGGEENELVRNDNIRKEIEDIIVEVFGEETMGFQPNQTDRDPFDSSESEESEESMSSEDFHGAEGEEATPILPGLAEYLGVDSDSICSPEYEPLSDFDI